jgi:TPR repeat protein
VKAAGKSLILAVLLGVAGTGGRSAAAQAPGVDAAVLARANAGDAAAQVQMGEHCVQQAANEQDPELRPDEYKQAEAWYKKAAAQGDLNGELHLAAFYRDGGKGFARDMVQAAAWYRKAAEQGDVGAQGTLGLLYSMGQGVQQDPVEAYFWLDLAASEPGPRQEQYAANRQMIGMQLTEDDVAAVRLRVKHWKAAHRPAGATQ